MTELKAELEKDIQMLISRTKEATASLSLKSLRDLVARLRSLQDRKIGIERKPKPADGATSLFGQVKPGKYMPFLSRN